MHEAAVPRFLVSTEHECLTAVAGTRDDSKIARSVAALLDILRALAPSLPGPAGLFNAYGRAYLDGSHLEFAAAECDSPYALATVVEQQFQLAATAVARLAGEGTQLILANHNHDGLLRDGAATWGTHENYLVEQPPSRFGALILPFLATRVYAGAGGVHFPGGDFLAGVRLHFLEQDTGGGTMHQRAIHSTARDEHLMGSTPGLYRYHTVLGDGNRSQFSLALKHGTTLLALKAILLNPDFLQPLPGTPAPHQTRRAFWMRAMRQFNLLAPLGQPPRVDPLAIRIQRLYLDGARRYADTLQPLPAWVPRLLDDWERTLDALAADDRSWLARRLDPWIKYELFSAALDEHGHGWQDLQRYEHLAYDLALLNQQYHEFCNPGSPFAQLDRAGLLAHRVTPPLPPGRESEPFVPDTTTRARTRARFLANQHDVPSLVMDWDAVYDTRRLQCRSLADPFAQEYGPWEAAGRGRSV